jgi:hypothetical protein
MVNHERWNSDNKSIEISTLDNILIEDNLFQSKVGRSVFKKNDRYYKIWDAHSIVSDTTEAGLISGFYDDNVSHCFEMLIRENGSNRGYILHEGEKCDLSGAKDWKHLVQITTIHQRLKFIKNYIDNSIRAGGCHIDLWPCNLILYKEIISLIDLDSYRSLKCIFSSKNSSFERFPDDRKYLERYLQKCIPSYLVDCLGMNNYPVIETVQDLVSIAELLRDYEVELQRTEGPKDPR